MLLCCTSTLQLLQRFNQLQLEYFLKQFFMSSRARALFSKLKMGRPGISNPNCTCVTTHMEMTSNKKVSLRAQTSLVGNYLRQPFFSLQRMAPYCLLSDKLPLRTASQNGSRKLIATCVFLFLHTVSPN